MNGQPPWCRKGFRAQELVYGDLLLSETVLYMFLRVGLTTETAILVPKYVVSGGHSPWKLWNGRRLARLLDTYAPASVGKAVELFTSEKHPLFGVPVYEAPVEEITVCRSPEAAVNDTLLALTRVGAAFLELRAMLSDTCRPRPTGSLLTWSLHASSDLDVVVPDLSCVVDLMDAAERRLIEPLAPGEVASWALREAKARMLDAEDVKPLYRAWARFRLSGTIVSTAFTNDHARSRAYRSPLRLRSSYVTCRAEVEPFQASLGDYPARAYARSGCIDIILLLDGLPVPALLEGGCFRVRGVEAFTDEGERVAVIGGREAPGTLVKPC